jgi:hypothetical protein
MPSSTPLRRHVACLAGGFTGAAASMILPTMILASFGPPARVVVRQLADVFDQGRTSLDTNLSLVWLLNLARAQRHATGPSRMSSPVTSTFAFRQLAVVNVFVDDARHRAAQAGQVGAAITLRNVVGETQHLLAVAAVPLHRHFDAIFVPWFAHGGKHVRVQVLALVDEGDKALDAAGAREVVFLAGALVLEERMRRCSKKLGSREYLLRISCDVFP